ncbi:MAG: tRNA epoxyqueuosine(34) reductase QueG [Planctomycetota bacterium]
MSGPDDDKRSLPDTSLSERILARCAGLGFARAGVCRVEPSAYESELRAWLEAGKHGEMGYLADQLAQRLDPTLVLPGVRSVVMVADRYAARGPGPKPGPKPGPEQGAGRIARYAQGRDYHRVIKRRLHALADALRDELGHGHGFRSFVDSAPVLEREHAARAGLGWVGKHTLLIDPELGSYFLIGGVYTTLDLPEPAGQRVVSDHCGTCTRCIDACPTDAITPYSVDATRCISYLTLEHRSPIDDVFYPAMGDWLAGCDICQEVCPHNAPRARADDRPVNKAYGGGRASLPVLDVLGWDADRRRDALTSSALKRVRLEMFKRNAAVVAGNLLAEGRLAPGDAALLVGRLLELATDADEPEMVRAAARWAVTRSPGSGSAAGG